MIRGDSTGLIILNAEEKKRKILKSKAFRDWWEVRQEERPIPSNPYRAFMIDRSLNAIVDRRDKWEDQPNRRDMPEIDTARKGIPTYAPSYKPRRRRSRKYKSPSVPKKGTGREVFNLAGEMATKHGLPAPEVNTTNREGPLGGYAKVGLGRGRDGTMYRLHGGKIHIGTKGSRVQALATTAHEVGHVVHAQKTANKNLPKGIDPYVGTTSSMSDELMATKLARKHLKESGTLKKKGELPIANWYLGYALNTYRKGWKRRNRKPKINKQGNLIGGAEFPALQKLKKTRKRGK